MTKAYLVAKTVAKAVDAVLAGVRKRLLQKRNSVFLRFVPVRLMLVTIIHFELMRWNAHGKESDFNR